MSATNRYDPPMWDAFTILIALVALAAFSFAAHCAYGDFSAESASLAQLKVPASGIAVGDAATHTRFVVSDSVVRQVPVGIPYDSAMRFISPVKVGNGVVLPDSIVARVMPSAKYSVKGASTIKAEGVKVADSGRILGIAYEPLVRAAQAKVKPAGVVGFGYNGYLYSNRANEAEAVTWLTKHGVKPGPANSIAKDFVSGAKSSIFKRSAIAVTVLGGGYIAIDVVRPKWSFMCKASAAIGAAAAVLLLFVGLQRRGIFA